MTKWLCSCLLLTLLLGACACQPKDVNINVNEKPAPIEQSEADINLREEQEAKDLIAARKRAAAAMRKQFAEVKNQASQNAELTSEAIEKCETVLQPMFLALENETTNKSVCIDVLAKGIDAVKELRSFNKIPDIYIDSLLKTMLSTKDALDASKIDTTINESFVSIGTVYQPEAQQDPPTDGDGKITLPSGLVYSISKEGKGEEAAEGMTVTVHYDGYLTSGEKFDSSRDREEAFSFRLGDGQVIEGWEEGVKGMKEGEVRHVIIPPELGYGEMGSGPIPGGATLVFDIELLKLNK